MKWMLISVCEREITTNIFNDYNEAYKTMRNEFVEAGGDDEMIEDMMADIDDYSAWVTDGNNHDDYDWKIIALKEES